MTAYKRLSMLIACCMFGMLAAFTARAEDCGFGASLHLEQPTEGAFYTRGDVVDIRWFADFIHPDGNVTTVAIELSSDGGETWELLADNLQTDLNVWQWTIPTGWSYGSNFYLRITELPDGVVFKCTPNAPATIGPFTIDRGCYPAAFKLNLTDQEVCEGEPVTWTVETDAVGAQYRWVQNGRTLAITDQNSYTIDAATVADAGYFYVTVIDECGSTSSSLNARFTVLAAPSITAQPVPALSVCEGTDAELTVGVSGDRLRYQWRKDGIEIDGATQRTFVIRNTNVTLAGSYDVLISGVCGSEVISEPSVVSVIERPRITSHPADAAVCIGSAHELFVNATGLDLGYQWYRNNEPIVGATSPALLIEAFDVAQQGRYHCVVTSLGETNGPCQRTVSSTVATVTAIRPPVITSHPASKDACVGSDLTMTVGVDGFDLRYQWFHNNVAITGADQHALTIEHVSANDAGTYTVEVTGACDLRVVTQPATITPVQLPVIYTHPRSQNVMLGAALQLSVVATDLRQVEWYHNSQRIQGANGQTLTISSTSLADAGVYYAIVRNVCGAALSTSARINVRDPQASGPELTLSQTSVDLGNAPVGYARTVDMQDLVRNTGNEPLVITSVHVEAEGISLVDAPATPFTLQPGQSRSFSARFMSDEIESLAGSITFVSNAPGPDAVVDLHAASVRYYAHEPSVDFQTISLGSEREQCIVLTNATNVGVTIDEATVVGTGAAAYSIQTSLPLVVPANVSANLCVRFTGNNAGQHVAGIDLRSSTGGNSSVFLTGVVNTTTSTNDDPAASLVAAYPNPMVDAITFRVPGANAVVSIVDATGSVVATIDASQAGELVQWNGMTSQGSMASSGVYTAIIRTGSATTTVPFTVVR